VGFFCLRHARLPQAHHPLVSLRRAGAGITMTGIRRQYNFDFRCFETATAAEILTY
jgi:hypothetical protein